MENNIENRKIVEKRIKSDFDVDGFVKYEENPTVS